MCASKDRIAAEHFEVVNVHFLYLAQSNTKLEESGAHKVLKKNVQTDIEYGCATTGQLKQSATES